MAKPRSARRKWLVEHISYPLESAFVHVICALFGALPVDTASNLGGRIARAVGPWLPGHRRARRNIERALPEKSPAEVDAILLGMWDNLGRVIAEYPHLDAIGEYGPNGRMELVGGEHFDALLADGKAGILVAGHLANWEAQSVTSRKWGLELGMVYRSPNNPLVAKLLVDLRGVASSTHIPKGAEGARILLRHLARGGHVGMMIDQKMNDGVPVPFFGRDAMTAPAPVTLALRMGIPLHPARTERLGGARFRLTIFPAMEPPNSGDRDTDVRIWMEHLNGLLEQWIRERPAEWLWLHRRWPD